MSRILRRPMFRGGRVDGRGTGITSGLGYEKGGRVNYQMGGNVRGGVVNLPGGYNQTANERLNLWKSELEKTKLRQPGVRIYNEPYIKQEWEDFKDQVYTGGIHETDLDYGMGLIPPRSIDEKNIMKLMEMNKEPELYEMFKSGSLPGSTIDYGTKKAEQMKADPSLFSEEVIETPEEGESRAEFEERIKREAAEELQALIKSQTDKDPAEEIAKNKKIFQEAYGSGVADDASRMLLSAAGRLLEPEATVKSAAGKFFGDESKVESKRSKYKDAATTAAINAYLTGQSSFQKFEDQLKLAKAGIDMKLEAGQPKNLDEALEFFRKTGDKLTSPGLMAKAVDKIYGARTFAGPLPEDSTELIIGKVYYADDPNNASNKVLFLIDENQKPQPIKTVYK